MLILRVTVTDHAGRLVTQYTMDHHDAAARRALGERCAEAFAAGQSVATSPVNPVALAQAAGVAA